MNTVNTIPKVESIPATSRAAMRELIKCYRSQGYAEVNALDNGPAFSGVKRWGIEVVVYKTAPKTLSISRKPSGDTMLGLLRRTATKARKSVNWYGQTTAQRVIVPVYYKQSRI